MTSERRDPFGHNCTVQERLAAMKQFTTGDLIDALNYTIGLQDAVRTIIYNRLTRIRKASQDPELILRIDDALWRGQPPNKEKPHARR